MNNQRNSYAQKLHNMRVAEILDRKPSLTIEQIDELQSKFVTEKNSARLLWRILKGWASNRGNTDIPIDEIFGLYHKFYDNSDFSTPHVIHQFGVDMDIIESHKFIQTHLTSGQNVHRSTPSTTKITVLK